MRVHLRKLTVTTPDGRVVPLVRSERTLYESTEPAPPPAPPSWLAGYLTIGVLIGALSYGLAAASPISRRARIAFLVTAYVWLLGSGIAGVVVAGLWGLTDHAAGYDNENTLQLSVLALPLLWFVTRLTLGRSAAARPAILLAGTTAALSFLGFLLQALPAFFQVNGGIIALALPAHAGVFAGILRLARPG
jgi:hypothetical protein